MRLICPNCDAQYEVDDAAIPSAGRDVECSSCGNTWFQRRPEMVQAANVTGLTPEKAQTAPATAAWGAAAAALDQDDTDERRVDSHASARLPQIGVAAGDAGQPMRRHVLDEGVLSILREEAAREAAVREAEQPPRAAPEPEIRRAAPPPEVGPSQMPPPAPPAASVPVPNAALSDRHIGATTPVETPKVAASPMSRRQLLPDIEEISKTLRAMGEPRNVRPRKKRRKPRREEDERGFRAGLVLVLGTLALLIAIYAFAPRVTAALPASRGFVQTYVNFVDRARLGMRAVLQPLDTFLRDLTNLGR